MKANYNGKEVDVEITDKAIVIDTGNDIIGFDLPAVRAVRTRDTGEIVIAYSTGAKVESITLKPLSDADRTNLILALTKNQETQKIVPDTVLDEEVERIYRNLKDKGESNIKLCLAGHEFEIIETDEFNNAWDTMKDILERKYGVNVYHPPRYIRDKPYEGQVGYAKLHYLVFLRDILRFLADIGVIFDINTMSYKRGFIDDWGFTIDDYLRYFKHYGIYVVELPKKLIDKLNECTASYVEELEQDEDYEGMEGYPRPPDYKSWF